MLKIIIKIFLLIPFLFSFAFSGKQEVKFNELFEVSEKSNTLNQLNSVSSAIYLKLNTKSANKLLTDNNNSIKIKDIVLNDNSFADIELVPTVPVIDQNTVIVEGSSTGLKTYKNKFDIKCYSGKIVGQENSHVFLNYFNGNIFGMIQNEDGEAFSLAPITYGDKKNSDHILKSHIDNGSETNGFKCLTEEGTFSSTETEDIIKNKNDELLASTLLEIKVACEGTYDFYELMGKDYNFSVGYITSVMNQVSKIYLDNLNVRIKISYLIVWTDANKDPYKGTSDLFDKLSTMPAVWSQSNVDRAVVSLFANLANQPANSTVAGIAYSGDPNTGTLCRKGLGYSAFGIRGNAIYPTLNYTWDVNCAAHELGHNFSSPHTHNCDYFKPAIDTCVTGTDPAGGGVADPCIKSGKAKPIFGTIMSYCHLTWPTRSVDLNFHPRCISLMRRAAEKATCRTEVSESVIHLLNPLGDKTYRAGTVEKIRWTHVNVKTVTLKYSFDDGKTWNLIKDNVNAADSVYLWTLPDVIEWRVWLLIHDASNPDINDKSMTYFAIVKPFLLLLNPEKSEKFGQKETVTINWDSYFVDSVRFEFSSNSGNSWTTIEPVIKNNFYSFKMPEVVSDKCKIKVVSLNNELISISNEFSIGKQTAKILSPKGGEVWCIGEFYTIEWESDFVSSLWIQFSTDEGLTWRKVTLGSFKPNINSYSWRIPERYSERTWLRAITTPEDSTIELDKIDYPFKLDSCSITGISEKSYSKLNQSFKIVSIIPNPASNLIKINIVNKKEESFEVNYKLFDGDGKILNSVSNKINLLPGDNILNLNLSEISQGEYIFFISSGNESETKSIKILR